MAKLWRSCGAPNAVAPGPAARYPGPMTTPGCGKMMRRAALLTTILGLAAGAAAAQPAPFDSMVVFGDSLSDNGNLSLSLGLPRMRFTTNPGQVAVEDVAQRYGLTLAPSVLGGSDYAYGGAGVIQNVFPVPTIAAQAQGYLAAHPQADPHALFAIWAGANDILAIDGSGAPLDQQSAQITAAARLEGRLIDQLQAAGVRRLIVFNVPDIGITPGAVAPDTALSRTYDAVLNGELAGRRGVVPVNIFLLLHEAVADPSAFGFANAATPACTTSTSILCTPQTLVQPDAPSAFVFADSVHPTTAAHQAVAELVISELEAPGRMSLLPEATLALSRDHRAAVGEELAREAPAGFSLFAVARAGRRRLGDDAFAPGSAGDDEGLTVGGVWRSGGGLAAGGALSAGRSRVALSGGGGGFTARQLAVSAFAQMSWSSGAWASLQAGLGRTDYDDIARSVPIGAELRTERSSSRGHGVTAELAAGRWFRRGGLATGPFAAFAYDRAHVKSFAETGGDSSAMWFAPQDREAPVARLGWSLKGQAHVGGIALQPVATVAWGHDFQADPTSVTAGLTTMNGAFDMPGWRPSRNWGEATLGLDANLGGGFRGRLTYQGLFGDKVRENLGSVGVSVSF